MNKREKNRNAIRLGYLGGKARAESLTPERRQEIARNAANKRWANHLKPHKELKLNDYSKKIIELGFLIIMATDIEKEIWPKGETDGIAISEMVWEAQEKLIKDLLQKFPEEKKKLKEKFLNMAALMLKVSDDTDHPRNECIDIILKW